MTKIIGFAGKKQSGKNTSCNFVLSLKLNEFGICEKSSLNQNGDIIVSDIMGQKVSGVDWIPLTPEYVDTKSFFGSFNPCKIYAFADMLKRTAIDVLGLPEEKVYGTDQDKSELTHLYWENMPGVIAPDLADQLWMGSADPKKHQNIAAQLPLVVHEPGLMTIRDVLQYLGTDIFRKMHQDVWVDATLRRIYQDQPELALICDVRFPNEIRAIQKKGGIVIGLERDIFNSTDSHASEQIDFSLCDYRIPDLGMEEMCNKVLDIVNSYGAFNRKILRSK